MVDMDNSTAPILHSCKLLIFSTVRGNLPLVCLAGLPTTMEPLGLHLETARSTPWSHILAHATCCRRNSLSLRKLTPTTKKKCKTFFQMRPTRSNASRSSSLQNRGNWTQRLRCESGGDSDAQIIIPHQCIWTCADANTHSTGCEFNANFCVVFFSPFFSVRPTIGGVKPAYNDKSFWLEVVVANNKILTAATERETIEGAARGNMNGDHPAYIKNTKHGGYRRLGTDFSDVKTTGSLSKRMHRIHATAPKFIKGRGTFSATPENVRGFVINLTQKAHIFPEILSAVPIALIGRKK